MSGVGVLVNDTDPDNNALTVALVSGPQSGSLTLLASGGFIYTPAIPFVGDVTFQYNRQRWVANLSVQTVTITVTIPLAPPPSSGGGSGGTGGNSGSTPSTGTPTDNNNVQPNTPNVVGPITEVVDRPQPRVAEESRASSDQSQSGSPSQSRGTDAIILESTSSDLVLVANNTSGTVLLSSNLVSENHRSVARLNAEQNARLVQELANTHTTFERLEDQLQTSNEVPPMQGVDMIAKTASVPVWWFG